MNKVVAVDVDATLASYDGWKGVTNIGEPLPGAVEFTRQLSEFAKVLIYSTRTSADANDREGADPESLKRILKDWLDRNGFTYSDIWIGQGKPMFAAIIDDRAVSCQPQEDPKAYAKAIAAARVLCKR